MTPLLFPRHHVPMARLLKVQLPLQQRLPLVPWRCVDVLLPFFFFPPFCSSPHAICLSFCGDGAPAGIALACWFPSHRRRTLHLGSRAAPHAPRFVLVPEPCRVGFVFSAFCRCPFPFFLPASDSPPSDSPVTRPWGRWASAFSKMPLLCFLLGFFCDGMRAPTATANARFPTLNTTLSCNRQAALPPFHHLLR